MTTVTAMRKRFDKVNLVTLTTDAMEEVPNEVVQYNIDQLDEGKNRIGDYILPEYHPVTVSVKKTKGQEFRFVTLQDTNEFRSKFFLNIAGNTYGINSSDSKTSALVAKYGEEIFGLTKAHQAELWEFGLSPLVVDKIRITTGAI